MFVAHKRDQVAFSRIPMAGAPDWRPQLQLGAGYIHCASVGGYKLSSVRGFQSLLRVLAFVIPKQCNIRGIFEYLFSFLF